MDSRRCIVHDFSLEQLRAVGNKLNDRFLTEVKDWDSWIAAGEQKPMSNKTKEAKIADIALTIRNVVCKACIESAGGCSEEHRPRCEAMYIAEATAVYEEHFAPLEDDLK